MTGLGPDIPTEGSLEHNVRLFRPEFLEAFKSETQWEFDTINEDVQEAVGLGATDCPLCGRHGWDRGQTTKRLLTGRDTGIRITDDRACECVALRAFWHVWGPAIPRRWRYVDLGQIKPNADESPMDMVRQATVNAAVKTNPGASYLFYGDAGTGKSLYQRALYRNALKEWAEHPRACSPQDYEYSVECADVTGNPPDTTGWPSAWYFSTDDILNKAYAHFLDKKNEPAPGISRDRIRKASADGFRPALFLSEIDKAGNSEFRMKTLAEWVDAVSEECGQIVMTSNLNPQELANLWGPKYADALLRRFASPPEGLSFNFSRTPRVSGPEKDANPPESVPCPTFALLEVVQPEATPTYPIDGDDVDYDCQPDPMDRVDRFGRY